MTPKQVLPKYPQETWLERVTMAHNMYETLKDWNTICFLNSLVICDMIKGNESHVGNIQFLFFNINRLSI